MVNAGGYYTHPDGKRGWYMHGLNEENDGTIDMRDMYGVRFIVDSKNNSPVTVTTTMYKVVTTGRHNLPDSTSAAVNISGPFPKEVTIPLSAFDYNRGQESPKVTIKEFKGSKLLRHESTVSPNKADDNKANDNK
jgi:hypothetical protein